MCCSRVCWLCVFVVTVTAMAANSPSIFMSVALTAGWRWKVLLPVCWESRHHSHTSHTHDNLLLSRKHTVSTGSCSNRCECVWDRDRQIEEERSVSSADQYQIQTSDPCANTQLFCFSCRVSYVIRDFFFFFRTTVTVTTFFVLLSSPKW